MTTQDAKSLQDLLSPYAQWAERYLQRWLVEPGTPDSLAEAMVYCALGGGKRLRPALIRLAADAVGATDPDELTARAAVAIELVHTYSLVHDDLPAMDDDDLRRGRPTVHIRYGQAMAILVGDALLTRAFGLLCEPHDDRSAALAYELAIGAGASGMVAGQVADMGLCELPDGAEGLRYIHLRKTAALIRAACRMGAICARADEAALDAIGQYGETIGLVFQLVDDLLDATAATETLGKTVGKDAATGKRTVVSELGIDAARRMTDELTARGVAVLEPLGNRGEKLRLLARALTERTH